MERVGAGSQPGLVQVDTVAVPSMDISYGLSSAFSIINSRSAMIW
jgi:hypothetical protein